MEDFIIMSFSELLTSWLTWPWTYMAILLAFNLKNIPFAWHFRFIHSMLDHLVFMPTKGQLTTECLFLPAITATRAPLTECDYNLHKSNSTYNTDLDISRGRLGLLLFREKLSVFPGRDATLVILSSTSIVFKREIKPYQPYEVWTRVLSWDKKWLYLVSHFVMKGKYKPTKYYLQPGRKGSPARIEEGEKAKEERLKGIFASSISRYVFKKGRKTVAPAEVLEGCGLVPFGYSDAVSSDDEETESNGSSTSKRTSNGGSERVRFEMEEETAEKIQVTETRRLESLPIAQLHAGWDAVHAEFQGGGQGVLGKYPDMLWV